MGKPVNIPATQPWQGGTSQHRDKYLQGQSPTPPLNHRLSVAHGLAKRNGTDLIETLSISSSEYVTTLQGRFIVIISDNGIRVYDLLDRQWRPVTSSTGDFDYLANGDRETLRTAEFLDTLIVANRTIATRFETTDDYQVIGRAEFYDDLDDDAQTGPASVGDYAEVLSSDNFAPRGFYKKTLLDTGETLWVRVPPPNSPNGRPIAETLPHQLQYQPSTGEFSWEQPTWDSRMSGSEVDNPAPSWAGSTIDAIAVFNQRLWIIGGGAVTAGDRAAPPRNPYNFYLWDVEEEARVDRIDEFIDDASVGQPLYARAMGNGIAIICSNGLGSFGSGGQRLDAFNGAWRTIERVGFADVEPASTGTDLMVLDSQGLVRWYSWDQGIRPNPPMNDHYQSLLDGREVERLSSSGSTLYVMTDDETFVWQGYPTPRGNVQSAWSRLRFSSDPIHVHRFDGLDFLICEDQLLSYYSREPNIPDDSEHEVCLDARERLQGVYDPKSNETIFELDRDATEATRMFQTFSNNGDQVSREVKPHRIIGNRVYISGDRSEYEHYLGDLYQTRADLPPASFGPSYVRSYWVGLDIGYRISTDFDLEAVVSGETFEEEWTSADMGDVDEMGPLLPKDGQYRFIVRGDSRDIERISIVSESAGYYEIAWWSPRIRGGSR
jgi:hypothetical protein